MLVFSVHVSWCVPELCITFLSPALASDVIINPSKKEVELNGTVSLVCSASGSFLSFTWLNGSSEVTAGERVQLTDGNSRLTITGVIRGDTGPYQCEASNTISKATSPLLNLTISGELFHYHFSSALLSYKYNLYSDDVWK